MKNMIKGCVLGAGMVASSLACAGYTTTKNPIVMVPGTLGFAKLFGAVDYYYQIPQALRADGAKVYVTSASAFTTSDARGEQLLAQLETIKAISGSSRFNLVGHSHGGAAVRYVAGVRPDLVASVTTVASPVKGLPYGDWAAIMSPLGGVVNAVFSLFDRLVAGTSYKEDFVNGLASMSYAETARFNARFPQAVPTTECGQGASSVNGIRYYSWSGASPVTNPVFDPLLDTFFGAMSLAHTGPNDGLVGKCSSHLGTVIRDDYRMNHGDEINQLLGAVSWLETNPKTVFRQHANRLQQAGL